MENQSQSKNQNLYGTIFFTLLAIGVPMLTNPPRFVIALFVALAIIFGILWL